jgi:quinol monooxygenase YgiN
METDMAASQAHGGQNDMYTTIRHYNVQPNSADEVIQRAVKGFVPIISKASGFLTYDLLNTGSDTVTTISTFENQAGTEKSNELAATWAQDNLASLLTGPPIIMGGKVSVHKTI